MDSSNDCGGLGGWIYVIIVDGWIYLIIVDGLADE